MQILSDGSPRSTIIPVPSAADASVIEDYTIPTMQTTPLKHNEAAGVLLTSYSLGRGGASVVDEKIHDSSEGESQEDKDVCPLSTPSASSGTTVGYLANRWNLGSSFSTPASLSNGGDDSLRYFMTNYRFGLVKFLTDNRLESYPPSSTSSNSSSNLPASQSQVRLSLSLEGKAEVVSNDLSPPRLLPPRPMSTLPSLPQIKPRTLQRSQSAVAVVTLPPISALTSSLPPRFNAGRSRDPHAWELCCDADTRDELTTQAENESNGSAIAAISLLRSTSGILQPNLSKRNSSGNRHLPRAHQTKKPRLAQSTSCVARMQNVNPGCDRPKLSTLAIEPSCDKKVQATRTSPCGDSDKENWSPKGNDSLHQQVSQRSGRRMLPDSQSLAISAQRQSAILQDQTRADLAPFDKMMVNSNLDPEFASARRKRSKLEIFEDADVGGQVNRDNEVERFMRGEVSPSKKGDMDCVAGLLSLSQGNWR
jgi:hypothetical protein